MSDTKQPTLCTIGAVGPPRSPPWSRRGQLVHGGGLGEIGYLIDETNSSVCKSFTLSERKSAPDAEASISTTRVLPCLADTVTLQRDPLLHLGGQVTQRVDYIVYLSGCGPRPIPYRDLCHTVHETLAAASVRRRGARESRQPHLCFPSSGVGDRPARRSVYLPAVGHTFSVRVRPGR